MNVLPNQRIAASDWAHHAWGHNAGMGLTVPSDALQALLDAYVEAATLRAAFEQRLRVTVETTGESAAGA